MSRIRLSLPPQIKKVIPILGTGLLVIIFLSSAFYVQRSRQVFKLLQENKYLQASQLAKQSQFLPEVLSAVTLRQSATLESWRLGLSFVAKLEPRLELLQKVGRGLIEGSGVEQSTPELGPTLEEISADLEHLTAVLGKSRFSKNWSMLPKLTTASELTRDLGQILEKTLGEPQTILVLLQNSEELRASGGFMGSYAKITIDGGKISHLEIRDIYEPDGIFTGFVEAPPGASEYLSAGKGLRLPDANWHPDFPSGAKIINSYFVLGKEGRINQIFTLNVTLVEKIMKIVGDIYLPDYGLTATADNLTALARADRNSFFAGSKGKTIFLSSLMTHLKLRLSQLDGPTLQQLGNIIFTGLEQKELQLFSWDESVQALYEKHHWAGALTRPPGADHYFYLVESNVGINKANRDITRTVSLDLEENRSTMSVTFTNREQELETAYINYQRLILDPETNLKELVYDGAPITKIDEEIITNTVGEKFKQLGFLLPLGAGASKTLTISLTHPSLCAAAVCHVALQKQSGLPATAYNLTFAGNNLNFILEQDELITIHQL